jgi:proteasome lid subunit RPN8/RPN11
VDRVSDSAHIRMGARQALEPAGGHMPLQRAIRWLSASDDFLSAPALRVFMTPSAYVRCCAHAGSDLKHEVGGALVGRWKVDTTTGQSYLVIDAVLPARHTRQGPAFLTFTQDSLVALNDELEERHPGRLMVGWYHTHPRMGVFLSGHDLWIHDHFFPEPWQVALVVEPVSRTGGFFVRDAAGALSGHAYSGFYELLRDGRSSVMVWGNLDKAEVGFEEGGAA